MAPVRAFSSAIGCNSGGTANADDIVLGFISRALM